MMVLKVTLQSSTALNELNIFLCFSILKVLFVHFRYYLIVFDTTEKKFTMFADLIQTKLNLRKINFINHLAGLANLVLPFFHHYSHPYARPYAHPNEHSYFQPYNRLDAQPYSHFHYHFHAHQCFHSYAILDFSATSPRILAQLCVSIMTSI